MKKTFISISLVLALIFLDFNGVYAEKITLNSDTENEFTLFKNYHIGAIEKYSENYCSVYQRFKKNPLKYVSYNPNWDTWISLKDPSFYSPQEIIGISSNEDIVCDSQSQLFKRGSQIIKEVRKMLKDPKWYLDEKMVDLYVQTIKQYVTLYGLADQKSKTIELGTKNLFIAWYAMSILEKSNWTIDSNMYSILGNVNGLTNTDAWKISGDLRPLFLKLNACYLLSKNKTQMWACFSEFERDFRNKYSFWR